MPAWSPILVQKVEIQALNLSIRKLQLNRHRLSEVHPTGTILRRSSSIFRVQDDNHRRQELPGQTRGPLPHTRQELGPRVHHEAQEPCPSAWSSTTNGRIAALPASAIITWDRDESTNCTPCSAGFRPKAV